MNMIRRWGDNDKHLGPLTYAEDTYYRPLAIILASGEEEYPGASLRFSGFGHTVILALPDWAVSPYREKRYPKSWDAATIERLGRNWYWAIDRREYGFSLSDRHLQVAFGRQSCDSNTEQRWGWFLPWMQWRHVRHSFYGLQGEYVVTVPEHRAVLGNQEWRQQQKALKDATPTVSFAFDDFDGERITATTKIEEREWHFGTGWFKWLSLFRRSKISRCLDLHFSAEVGESKGSWKGGTVGHAIEMRSGELHEAAFRRYCDQHDLTFIDEE